MENNPTNPAENPSSGSGQNVVNEVKSFYKNDFKKIFTSLFREPIDGLYNLFKEPGEKALTHALIIFASAYLTYLVGFKLLIWKVDLDEFFVASLWPVVVMFLLSIISFIIKSFSVKADFNTELLTGAVAGVPLMLLMPILLIVKLLFSDEKLAKMVLYGRFGDMGVLWFLIMLYILIMMFNVFKQSLSASGVKQNVSFYISPAAVMLALYISYKIFSELM